MADDKVRVIFERAGCTGSPPARSLDGDAEFGVRADEPVVPASVVKVLIALVAETWFAEGLLDPRERVVPGAAERTPGPVGVSPFENDAVLSLRDLVVLMPTSRDNPSAGRDLGPADRTARRPGSRPAPTDDRRRQERRDPARGPPRHRATRSRRSG
ncbi:serine hydrolase [Streptomyces sp. NEAU-sy36]|uniref:serine hydrolase n=1 Tax=Streptomyces sp. NEAU-H33 TaxID=2979463 RepID=UPI0015D615EF|nr:serine hydrolase [Streptomyces sp. NEAU-H33]QLJ02099.1 serine hydrolase [Streptomyces sp. NEAU-sy36]